MAHREDLEPRRLLAIEQEVLALWDAERTFQASLEQRRGAEPFVFYEGPPTANGRPGIHHVLGRGMKDLACRLRTMQGRFVERRAGWDTHGLPVEIETERALGLESKKAIEELGIDRFNEACRSSVFRYVEDWTRLTKRMGYWVDLDHPYVTCSRDYVESLWWILAELHRKGRLYRGHKVLPYCPRCATPLSSHEVGLGFKDVQDPSVFVRFRAADGEPPAAQGGADAAGEASAGFLVWTTTPWTLPANVALAVHPDVDYVEVEVTEGERRGTRVWLADARREALGAPHEVVGRAPGRDLVGRRYARLLDWYPVAAAPVAFTVVAADFVSTEEGTGIVHLAPAYGEEDAQVGRRLGLPVLHPVDAEGRFREGAPVAGRFVKEADREIVRHLRDEGLLWRHETVVHAYPHCWRCDSPLLYYARDSWYLRTTAFKARMLELNAQVTWVPESVGRGRFGQWLENNVDWAVSRDRYWGTPLPVWICDAKRCATETAIGSYEDLERLSGTRLEDPHRPFVDAVTWACLVPGCGGTMRRTPEVADAWFDSGSMPFAQWHWPFENRERFAESHPADFIAEGVDQTRGWFYTLLAVSVMLTEQPAYRTCVSFDHVLDAAGKKMSKSKGNVVDPFEMIERHGADVVRWHLLARSLGTPLRYEEKDLVEIRNRFFGTLLNVYAFLATYANVDGWGRDEVVPPARRPVFDRWLLSRLHGVVADVDRHLAVFDTGRAGQRIAEFVVEDLSNWYVRRNRRRFFRAELSEDKRSGYQTLQEALLVVSRLAAPFAPFVTDALHRALLGGAGEEPRSVHLADWPVAEEGLVDPSLEAGMAAVRRVAALGHAARDAAGIRVRQPLSRLQVWGLGEEERGFVLRGAEILREELNVKTVAFLEEPGPGCRLRATLDKREAARRLGPRTPAVARALEGLDSAGVAALVRAPSPLVQTDEGEVALRLSDLRVEVSCGGDLAGQFGGGLLVTLDLSLSDELRREGLAREVLRRLQDLRKRRGLRVEERVRVRWHAAGEAARALEAFGGWMAEELLAVDFARAESREGLESLDVPGEEPVLAGLDRA